MNNLDYTLLNNPTELLERLEKAEKQLDESDHALDCMTSSAGELQDVCDKLEKQLEAVRKWEKKYLSCKISYQAKKAFDSAIGEES